RQCARHGDDAQLLSAWGAGGQPFHGALLRGADLRCHEPERCGARMAGEGAGQQGRVVPILSVRCPFRWAERRSAVRATGGVVEARRGGAVIVVTGLGMKATGEDYSVSMLSALAAEVEAVAHEEHRPVEELVLDAVK